MSIPETDRNINSVCQSTPAAGRKCGAAGTRLVLVLLFCVLQIDPVKATELQTVDLQAEWPDDQTADLFTEPSTGSWLSEFSSISPASAVFRHAGAESTVDEVYRSVAKDDMRFRPFPCSQLFGTYIAGPKEPRMQMLWMRDSRSDETYGDAVLGGRVGLFRIEGDDSLAEQFQLDLDGAVLARILPNAESTALKGSDYLVAMWGTWKSGPLAFRTGYRHLSSHLGDEFMLLNPSYPRRNYVRDSLLVALSYRPDEQWRIYGEYGYAPGVGGGALPNECQFGGEWTGARRPREYGAPFSAINVQFREEQHGNAGVNVSAGWGWRADENGRHLRVGMNYYNGPSLQYSFVDTDERLIGGGIWLDF